MFSVNSGSMFIISLMLFEQNGALLHDVGFFRKFLDIEFGWKYLIWKTDLEVWISNQVSCWGFEMWLLGVKEKLRQMLSEFEMNRHSCLSEQFK